MSAVVVLDKISCNNLSSLDPTEVYAELVTTSEGLSQVEAEARLRTFGPNTIEKKKATPLIFKLLANFTHLMALLLWAGGIVGFLAQMPQLGFAIWTVNLINGFFSFWQEYKAEKAIEALQKLLPTYATVIRDGKSQEILASDLVPGDLLVLAEGDHISADARLVEAADLRIDQATLTGESKPVLKLATNVAANQLSNYEVANLVFAGTNVLTGTGQAVVFGTGVRTEFGKIARLTQSVAEIASPLQQELGRATKTITFLSTGIGTIFFLLAILFVKIDLVQGFIFAMGMIVAFVPEGLLPTVTLSLAMGVQRMAKRNALVKRLASVETLGCTNIICTDKTGTLTQNQMTVTNIWLPAHQITVVGNGYVPSGKLLENNQPIATPVTKDLRLLLAVAGLCNDAKLLEPTNEIKEWRELGDPTEAALEVVALKGGLDLKKENSLTPRLKELPFNSYRKCMSTVHTSNQELLVYTKGAVEAVLSRCSAIQVEGQFQLLTPNTRNNVIQANDNFAKDGLRVLALAWRKLPVQTQDFTAEAVENELIFLGLIAMRDQPRPGVAEAVAKCHEAGIRVVMITGDYELTASSIAQNLGIVSGQDFQVINGVALDRMSATELEAALQHEVIFARVKPEHKLRIVTTFQDMGLIVAVTGDGVNDAPALKKANIGIAMGVAGTDVAKEAADIILTDDNFASIVNAIEEGRAIYSNIRKFLVYVFNSNMAEAVPFIVMLFSQALIPLPLTVMQVLAVDLGTDMLPAIGLGADPPEPNIMKLPPRSRKEPLLNAKLLTKALLWYGMIESLAAMSAYFFLNWRFGWPQQSLAAEGTTIYRLATTMTLAAIVAGQVGAVFGCRSNKLSVVSIGFTTNRLLLLGVGVELALLVGLVYLPFMQSIFNTANLDWIDWAFVFTWTIIMLIADELRKLLLRLRPADTKVQ